MKTSLPLVLAFFALLLAGCRVELPPIDTGFMSRTWMKSDGSNRTELSPEQLDALKAWFATHQDGWEYRIADIAPDTFLFFPQRKGKDAWVYLNGNQVCVRNRVKTLTGEERVALDAILNPPNARPLPTFR